MMTITILDIIEIVLGIVLGITAYKIVVNQNNLIKNQEILAKKIVKIATKHNDLVDDLFGRPKKINTIELEEDISPEEIKERMQETLNKIFDHVGIKLTLQEQLDKALENENYELANQLKKEIENQKNNTEND